MIVQRYEPYLSQLAYRLTGWSADSADVVQETLVVAWSKLSTFRGDSSLKTWLTGIAVRVARGHQRSETRWRRWLGMDRGVPAGTELTPGDRLASAERQQHVHRALRRLSAGDREVIVLRYLESMSIAKMAEALGVRRNAVDTRLHRAKARLAKALSEEQA